MKRNIAGLLNSIQMYPIMDNVLDVLLRTSTTGHKQGDF